VVKDGVICGDSLVLNNQWHDAMHLLPIRDGDAASLPSES
jgi:hypothetical protein